MALNRNFYPGSTMIARERARQVVREGYTDIHDDAHDSGELLNAALWYLRHVIGHPMPPWPFEANAWKPSDPIRDLTKAGAFIAAEIDRLQRNG